MKKHKILIISKDPKLAMMLLECFPEYYFQAVDSISEAVQKTRVQLDISLVILTVDQSIEDYPLCLDSLFPMPLIKLGGQKKTLWFDYPILDIDIFSVQLRSLIEKA